MSSSTRDLIQISLGSTSNAITAHVLNLQGLAGTKDYGLSHTIHQEECEVSTTHRWERNFVVPRCLMVDEPTRFFVSASSDKVSHLQLQSEATTTDTGGFFSSSFFAVEPLNPTLSLSHSTPSPWAKDYQSKAATLAYSRFSRYYQDAPPKYTAAATAAGGASSSSSRSATYHVSADNARHVNWDEQGDEDDEVDDDHATDMEEWRERQAWTAQQERNKWQRDTFEPLQSELLQQGVTTTTTTTMSSSSLSSPLQQELSWMDFWMPPYSEKSKIPLEHSHQSMLAPHWDAYSQNLIGGSSQHRRWMEDTLLERLRHLLEESDSCQGFLLTTEGYGLYASMATALLQELQQESKSAGRMVFHVTNPSLPTNTTMGQPDDAENEPWQPAQVQRVRRHVSSGLALYDFTMNAHVVVPLELDNSLPLFQASANIAMALEAATLPIRLAGRSPRRIGLTNTPFVGQGGEYDMHWGSTAQHLGMGEYIQCLSPSSQYKVLELDTLGSTNLDHEQLWQALLIGTSLERDARTRDAGNSRHGSRDVPPGGWLQSVTTPSRDPGHGLLSCLSPSPCADPRFADRSLHHHFALATAIRPMQLESDSDPRYQYDPTAKTLGHYLTATIQGMGIAYRPDRSMAVIGSQTHGQLTFANPSSGGAGAYWRSLVTTAEHPTVAVLGNSTRVYGYMNQVSSDMKLVLGSRYRGYHQRDIVNEVLPEEADCQEALEGCFDLRDIYQPPDGSGLVNGDDSDLGF